MVAVLPGDAEEDERIARSFILTNLPELKVKYDDECAAEDYKAVSEICSFLRIPPPIDQTKVERVGIRLIDEVFRDVKVELQDPEHVQLVFARLNWFKNIPVLSTLKITRAERWPPVKNYRWIPGIGFTIDQTIPAPPKTIRCSRYF